MFFHKQWSVWLTEAELNLIFNDDNINLNCFFVFFFVFFFLILNFFYTIFFFLIFFFIFSIHSYRAVVIIFNIRYMTYFDVKDLKYFNKNFTFQHFSAQLSTNVKRSFSFHSVVSDRTMTSHMKLKKHLRFNIKSFLMKNSKLKKKWSCSWILIEFSTLFNVWSYNLIKKTNIKTKLIISVICSDVVQ